MHKVINLAGLGAAQDFYLMLCIKERIRSFFCLTPIPKGSKFYFISKMGEIFLQCKLEIVMNLPVAAVVPETEELCFELDKTEAIRQLVMSQSSSPEKAVLELVMNALDHGATKIEIRYDSAGFSVRDNGSGLTDIKSFQSFCLKQTDSKIFGRFRLGRAQIMGLSHVQWRSCTYLIDVNLFSDEGNSEYGFTKHNGLEHIKGTIVEGSWYSKVNVYSARQLREHLQYVDFAEITINGVAIITSVNWDYEDDICKIKFKNAYSGTNFYNRGVHIIEHSRHRYRGVDADINFLTSPDLNISRNELSDHCPVVKHVLKVLNELSLQRNKQKKYHSDEDRKYLIETMLSDEELRKELLGEPLLQLANKKKESIGGRFVFHKPWCLVDGTHNVELYRKSIKAGHVVITQHELMVWGVNNLKELYAKVNRLLPQGFKIPHLQEVTFENIEQVLELETEFIDTASLSPLQKCQRNCLQYVANGMAKRLKQPQRIIRFGIPKDSATCGWTDGRSFIAINKDVSDRLFASEIGPVNLCLLLAHEFTHTSDLNGHDETFYENFHDSIIAGVGSVSNDLLGNAVKSLSTKYASELEATGLGFPKHLAHLNGLAQYNFYLRTAKPTKLLQWYFSELKLSWTIKKGILTTFVPRGRNGIHERGLKFIERMRLHLASMVGVTMDRKNVWRGNADFWQKPEVFEALTQYLYDVCGADSEAAAKQLLTLFNVRGYEKLLTNLVLYSCFGVKCVNTEMQHYRREAHVELMEFGLDIDTYELLGTRFYTVEVPNLLNQISESSQIQDALFTERLRSLFMDIHSQEDRKRLASQFMHSEALAKLNI